MNKYFADAAKACIQSDKKLGSMWVSMLLATAAFCEAQSPDEKTVDNALIAATGEKYVTARFKLAEDEFAAANKGSKLSERGAWRSAKSVIISAVKAGVDLFENNVPRGKSAVEKDVKATRSEKATVDKIKGSLETINKILDSDKNDMIKSEYAVLGGLVRDLTLKLANQMGEAAEAR